MRKLSTKAAAFFMSAVISVTSCVCIPNMKVKAEIPVATVTDADGNIGDNQPEEITDDLDLIDTETTDESEVVDTEVEATKIPIDSAHFPDDVFRNYVKSEFDTNSDGVLSKDEIDYATFIDVNNSNVSSLKGIEYFTELRGLSCENNNISTLDLSNCHYLWTLECSENKIKKLDLRNNFFLFAVDCDNNELENIYFGKHSYLLVDCCDNKLRELDLRETYDFMVLSCIGNNLNNVLMGENTTFKILECDEGIAKNQNFVKAASELWIFKAVGENMQYDLSRLPWLQIDKIISLVFYDENDNYDQNSYLSGSVAYLRNKETGYIKFNYENQVIQIYYYPFPHMDEEDIKPEIFVVNNDRYHYVAGIVTSCKDDEKELLEYSWVAQDSDGNFIQMSDWSKSEWVDWTPAKYGTYTIYAKAKFNGKEDQIFTTVGQYDYHPFIKGKCQMPYSGEQGVGYLIGVESYENPNQKYQYEMLILDCTLLAQGLPAWTYTTGKFTVPEGNAGWCIWTPQYGYYWTLFRVYDENGVLIDEQCYGFQNIC